MTDEQADATQARKQVIRDDRARMAERAFVHAGYLPTCETEDSGQLKDALGHFIADALHLAAKRGQPIEDEDDFLHLILKPAMRYYRADGGKIDSTTLDQEDAGR